MSKEEQMLATTLSSSLGDMIDDVVHRVDPMMTTGVER
jgi:hypothetical protein